MNISSEPAGTDFATGIMQVAPDGGISVAVMRARDAGAAPRSREAM